MQKDRIVTEIQRRINLIKTADGHSFDVAYVFRNPEEEPSPDLMPLTNIFEFPSTTLDSIKRGATKKPIYKKFFRVVLEHWYHSDSIGDTNKDLSKFLTSARLVIFSDGQTLGGLASAVVEEEESRVYRPLPKVIGIGEVLGIEYIEDFNKL